MSESSRLTHSAKEGTFLWPTDFVLGNVGDLQRLDPFSLVPQLGPGVRRITRSRAYGNTGIPHILRHNTGRHQSGKKLVLRRKASVPQPLSAHNSMDGDAHVPAPTPPGRRPQRPQKARPRVGAACARCQKRKIRVSKLFPLLFQKIILD